MMNRAVKQFTSAALSLAIVMSMGVAVNAKPTSSRGMLTSTTKTTSTAKTTTGTSAAQTTAAPAAATPNDYSINVTGNEVQFIRNGQVVGVYAAKSPDIKVALSQSGNLVLNFIKDDGKAVNVSLGQQKNVVLGGSYGTLTIDGSVPAGRSFTVSGTATALNVNAPVHMTVASGASVSSLKVGSGTAKVAVDSGAKVSAASAVTASSVTGFSGTVSKAQAVTAPKATTINAKSGKTGLKVGGTAGSAASSAGKETVYLDMQEKDDKYTEEVNFMSNNGVELIAKSGYSLGQAIKDVTLEVTHDTDKDNDRVGGSWKWVDVASTTHTSGTYTYRFYPSLSSKYPTVDVTVKYVGNGESTSTKSLGKPSISFANKSHGDGKSVRIDVRIPSGIDDDATLELYVDRDLYEERGLDEDDAGDENSYTVTVDTSGHEDDDEVKIQVKVKSNGRTTTSNTIKYRLELDGDSSSGTVGKLSISGDTRGDNDPFDIRIQIPNTDFKGGTLSVQVDNGSASPSSQSVSKGDTVTVTITPRVSKNDKGNDRVVRIKAKLKTSDKGTSPQATHKYTVDKEDD